MPSGDHKHTNRLIHESSPYLLQHAHNPVDWYPWCDEAFDDARRRDVPVFLSIGYSTCYWCHVMERESFESASVARVMNERFVCIKVDREERPDIDEIYMGATQIFSGSGGWPMSVFLEPNTRKPFWCGTYFPPEPMHGRPSFTQILHSLSDAFTTRRDEVDEQSENLANAVRDQLVANDAPVAIGIAHITRATGALLTQFDRTNGGFGGAPKFPQPVYLEYLLDTRERADEPTRRAIDAAIRKTLDAMAIGGIHDHIAGGFHRYAVDATWTVPHFEKMLYDNAQLTRVYARASKVYNDAFYKRVAQRTMDYVLREMTHADLGCFYSAQDAEVDGREGLNYLWTHEDMIAALDDDAEWAMRVYSMDRGSNFRDPHHPHEPMKNVLRFDDRPEQIASSMRMDIDTFWSRLDAINEKLSETRAKREQPGLDDKSICAWNAMMIGALVAGAEALDEPRYIHAAQRCVGFILERMRTSDGLLARSFRDGKTSAAAPLEDYAYLIEALIALHESPMCEDESMIDHAIEWMHTAHTRFADEQGAYFDTDADRTDLFVRARSIYDGAVPSAIGVMLGNMVALARITRDEIWIDRATDLLRTLSAAIARNAIAPINSTRHLLSMIAMPDLFKDPDLIASMDDEESSSTHPHQRGAVDVFVSADEIEIADDTPGVFQIALEIPDGYHIVAADPGREDLGLIPLRAGLISGQGVAVYAEYPNGEPMGVESIGKINVYTGRVEFEVAIEKAPGVGPSIGEPILGVSFQACTDNACNAPRTIELKVAISIS